MAISTPLTHRPPAIVETGGIKSYWSDIGVFESALNVFLFTADSAAYGVNVCILVNSKPEVVCKVLLKSLVMFCVEDSFCCD